MRGGACASHRVRTCETWVGVGEERRLERRRALVVCDGGADGTECTQLAVDAAGLFIPAARAATQLECLCGKHGGGRRCSQPDCNRAAGAWAWRHQHVRGLQHSERDASGLCERCAAKAGRKPAWAPASHEADACLSMLVATGAEPGLEYMHWNAVSGEWEGEEVEGLVAPRYDRPDGVVRDAAGRVTRVYFYHGVHIHGYPRWHMLHNSWLRLPKRPAEEAYAATLESMQRFRAAGYEVRYVWSCEFERFWGPRKSRVPAEVSSIVHAL